MVDGMVWSCKAKPGCSINTVDFSQLPAGEERAEVPGIKGGTDRNRLWWNFGLLEVLHFSTFDLVMIYGRYVWLRNL